MKKLHLLLGLFIGFTIYSITSSAQKECSGWVHQSGRVAIYVTLMNYSANAIPWASKGGSLRVLPSSGLIGGNNSSQNFTITGFKFDGTDNATITWGQSDYLCTSTWTAYLDPVDIDPNTGKGYKVFCYTLTSSDPNKSCEDGRVAGNSVSFDYDKAQSKSALPHGNI